MSQPSQSSTEAYLAFANLQMAAEAFFVPKTSPAHTTLSVESAARLDLVTVLKVGNVKPRAINRRVF